jgi:hypothetical protein
MTEPRGLVEAGAARDSHLHKLGAHRHVPRTVQIKKSGLPDGRPLRTDWKNLI